MGRSLIPGKTVLSWVIDWPGGGVCALGEMVRERKSQIEREKQLLSQNKTQSDECSVDYEFFLGWRHQNNHDGLLFLASRADMTVVG
jgi:hypothetical protein